MMPTWWYACSTNAAFVISIIFGYFIYRTNRQNPINKWYALVCLCVGFYCLDSFIIAFLPSTKWTIYIARLLYFGPIFSSVCYLHWIHALTRTKDERKAFSTYLKFIDVSGIALTIVGWTPLFIRGINPSHYFIKFVDPGPLYILFVIFIWLNGIIGLYTLLVNIKFTYGSKKTHMIYITAASFVMYIGALLYLLFVYRIINLIPIGDFFSIISNSVITYAIIRHHLMDIEVVIKKTLVFAGLSALVFGCIIITTFTIQDVLGRFIGLPKALSYVVISITLIALYDPLKKYLVNATNKYLFQKKYDYRQVMESFIDDIVTLLDLDKIVAGTLELLDKTLHPQHSAILLLNSSKDKYVSHSLKNESNTQSIDNSSGIPDYLKTVKDVLSIEDENDKKINEKMKNEMVNLKANLAVPLMLRDDLIGIMVLGKKKSDEYYTKEDINILLDLARTEAIALKNAEFIKERDAMHMDMMQAKLKEELATMADGMSHQFNNKFQGISSAIRFVKQMLSQVNVSSENKDKYQNIVDIMTQAEDTALAAGDIATGLLNFTRPKRVQYEMVNIAGNVDVVLQLIEYKHKDFNQIEVIKKIEENLPLTYAHLGYFQEIYFIMIDNAYDAIQYKRDDAPNFKGRIAISVSSDKRTNEIIIVTTDNGSGMKPQVLENVKNAIPYFTTKASSGKSGYGAGTQVLRRLVEFHKGKISYESADGEGTAVTIRIPITGKSDDFAARSEGESNGKNLNS